MRVLCFLVLLSTTAFGLEVDPKVLQMLRSNSREMTVIVSLRGEMNLNHISSFFLDSAESRGKHVAEELERFHSERSAGLIRFLQRANSRDLKSVTPLWIVNALRVTGSQALVRSLMSANGIDRIDLDEPKEVDGIFSVLANAANAVMPKRSWGIDKMRANELWDKGIRGKGTLVAMIDSGAALTHPDLANNLWQNPGEVGLDAQGRDKATNGIDDDGNGYVDDVVGWNFEGKNGDPTDSHGHGSQTAGIVAGNGAGGTQTGVAPEARLMILRACCSINQTAAVESNAWEAIQYAVKNGARVISMSMSIKHHSRPTYAKWRRVSEVVLAAGVIHVNSAGNRGSGAAPFNMGAPASNPPAWLHPGQPLVGGLSSMITIGATDKQDTLRGYSSTGPVTWEAVSEYEDYAYDKGNKPGLIRPDVCGPSEVPSTSKDGTSYTQSFGGTSSATPMVAGVVALLVSARPQLTVAQVTEALQMSAVQVDQPFSNKCGAGRVDAVAALEYARTHF